MARVEVGNVPQASDAAWDILRWARPQPTPRLRVAEGVEVAARVGNQHRVRGRT